MPEASLRRSHSTLIALSSFINVRAAGLVGNRVGQLGFSWFTDILSHQNGVGFMIDIIGSSGQAPTVGTVGTLITWRFIVHTLLLITLSLP
ncbi:hypothetical protein EDD16DRAFT_1642460 [Pisolithus croceorrhizus]|nr:hypothetical protein EDD16DRAFT_1642460 [Pisolithus croceorrhizus]